MQLEPQPRAAQATSPSSDVYGVLRIAPSSTSEYLSTLPTVQFLFEETLSRSTSFALRHLAALLSVAIR